WRVKENSLVLYGGAPPLAAPPLPRLRVSKRGGHGGPPVQDYVTIEPKTLLSTTDIGTHNPNPIPPLAIPVGFRTARRPFLPPTLSMPPQAPAGTLGDAAPLRAHA